ncbi:MAG: hypothetical protein K7J46_21305 [Bryobacter sp.]|jgi:hypothetical protein|nr:hypothetical protein [Bryobacter sp. CoA8 C33]
MKEAHAEKKRLIKGWKKAINAYSSGSGKKKTGVAGDSHSPTLPAPWRQFCSSLLQNCRFSRFSPNLGGVSVSA